MKRTFLVICIAAVSACVSPGTSSLESRFSRERPTLTCLEGSTSEQSCGGAGLSVYLNARQVRHLDWFMETSTQFIRRKYYFDGPSPRLAVESIYAKFGPHAEPLREPRLLSMERYHLDASQPKAKQKELRDHADFLIDDFHKQRKEFTRAIERNG